jgi:hypothetical protein
VFINWPADGGPAFGAPFGATHVMIFSPAFPFRAVPGWKQGGQQCDAYRVRKGCFRWRNRQVVVRADTPPDHAWGSRSKLANRILSTAFSFIGTKPESLRTEARTISRCLRKAGDCKQISLELELYGPIWPQRSTSSLKIGLGYPASRLPRACSRSSTRAKTRTTMLTSSSGFEGRSSGSNASPTTIF